MTLICVYAAVLLALCDSPHWGWFLFAAVLLK
jgi:hypothetical protein